ncbi:CTP-phosphoethanolamine cytidylyltransferase [Theileria orientalis strain Shintoku]|uniref:ethanolamine-phosphate cytidylyltransferase n=1 Tax=Theileria orientalis strain Shintoku TaxID=869250 RepID=J7MGW7_THEOR|nr:CTP-phosphoethanolamine cytidylyltransferase [Theileria orientalis strain Shintoku]BAM42346.1 CTP-phosphoethanolamine cytidylyltransferase [Theileria orientalis strain Shintoku]|eukprot:XP_009692647.1 CTP-phosphoethanolamine cytidylyltransferase [Theileria orientalis strain Shintoku]
MVDSKVDLKNLSESRIYVDGVFDLIHWGHLNALRQSYELGGKLVIGIISDEETRRAKGICPIYTQEERAEIVMGCKWVDEVMVGVPYDVTLDFLLNTAKCDYVAHGDDIAIGTSGKDCYLEPKNAGLMIHFKRSYGVSTSTTLSRLIESLEFERFYHLANENHQAVSSDFDKALKKNEHELLTEGLTDVESARQLGERHVSYPRCRLSLNLLSKFLSNKDRPGQGKVVYVDGSFDLFHNGHVRFLKAARALGDYLIVGIYDDQTVRTIKGSPFPFTNMLDRCLIVSAMKYTDDVILGAPYKITKDFVKIYGIDIVAVGKYSDSRLIHVKSNPLEVVENMGILRFVDSGSKTTSMEIIKRVSDRIVHIRDNVTDRCRRESIHYKAYE